MEDIRILFFLHIVATTIITTAGFLVMKQPIDFKKIITIGVLQGSIVWLVRGMYATFNIPLGTHTVVFVITRTLVIKVIAKVDWYMALGIALVGGALVSLGNIVPATIMTAMGISLQELFLNPWLHIMVGWTEDTFAIILIIGHFIFNRKRKIKGGSTSPQSTVVSSLRINKWH